jgi:hypothetical protein
MIESQQANRWLSETNAMSVVCDTDVVDGVETPVIAKEDGKVGTANTGEHQSGSAVGDCCVEILTATKVNGICVEENTSNGNARNRSTSETWIAENTEDDHIVDFLDKNNEKVYFYVRFEVFRIMGCYTVWLL